MNRNEAEALLFATLEAIRQRGNKLPQDVDGLSRLVRLIRDLEHVRAELV